MPRNPHRVGTKFNYLYEIFTHKTVPRYDLLLEDVNNRFPGNPSSHGSLKQYKATLRKKGVRLGKQYQMRSPVPTPKGFAALMAKLGESARVDLTVDLLKLLGYGKGAKFLRGSK